MLRELGRILSFVAIPLMLAARAYAIEPPILLKEGAGRDAAPDQQGCPLEPNLTGDCANLRYYNLCASYLWIYSSGPASVGVQYQNPCIATGGALKSAITYWRNAVPGYGNVIDVFLSADADADGCPDGDLASDLAIDPALRWNCSQFDYCLQSGLPAVIVRSQTHGSFPTLVTDGARSETCDPAGSDHSYYYGTGNEVCIPWRLISPTGRGDNFLYWLIVDSGCTTSTEPTSWGTIKGLFK
jgi:hypothetical protein